MVKKFTTNCDFGGQKFPITLYVGTPFLGTHPLNFQSKWLGEKKGGAIPSSVMESFSKIMEISEKTKVPFEDLCAYVIDEINSEQALKKDAKLASEFSSSDSSGSTSSNNSDTKKS